MKFLNILKSKTVWGAIGLATINTLPMAAPYVQGTPVGAALNLALLGITIYGRVKAKQPLGPVVDDTIAQTVAVIKQLNPSTPISTTEVTAIVKASN